MRRIILRLRRLAWRVTKKLRHYMLAYQVLIISRMDPLKYLFENPALTGRMARWLIVLSEFDLKYVTRKSIKGRAVYYNKKVYFAEFPTEAHGAVELDFDLPDEEILEIDVQRGWKIDFDGAANQKGYVIGIVLVAPDDAYFPIAVKLNFPATNNVAEYEACIGGMEALLALGVKEV